MNKFLILAAILGLTVLVYANSLHGALQFDDVAIEQRLTGNMPAPVAREMGVDHRPIQWASYWVNYQLGGMQTFGYHVGNLLVHLVSVALVFFLVLELVESLFAAGAGALVFAIHPFFSGAVDYIYARGSMLAAMFVFAACLAGLKIRGWWKWPVMAVLLALGVASKEEALIAPAFFFAYAMVERKKVLAWVSAGLMVTGLAVVLFLAPQVGTPLNTRIVNPIWDLVLNYGQGLTLEQHWQAVLNGYSFHTLGNLALPLWLTADPDLVHGDDLWIVSLGIIATLAVGFFLVRSKGIRLGLAAMLASPILGAMVVLVAEPLFEYRAYIGGLGVALLAGTLLEAAWKRVGAAALYSFGAAVLMLSLGTMHRNELWKSPVPLWEDAHAKTPWKKRPVLNLSAQYLLTGQKEKAEEILKQIIVRYPGFRAAHVNLSAVYVDQGDCIHGEPEARKGVPVAIAYGYIAICRLQQKDYENALKNADMTILLDPNMTFARMIRLSILKEMGRDQEELTVLEQQVKENPKDLMANISLAMLYRMTGDTATAQKIEAVIPTLKPSL